MRIVHFKASNPPSRGGRTCMGRDTRPPVEVERKGQRNIRRDRLAKIEAREAREAIRFGVEFF